MVLHCQASFSNQRVVSDDDDDVRVGNRREYFNYFFIYYYDLVFILTPTENA